MSVECRSRPISLRSGPRREPVPFDAMTARAVALAGEDRLPVRGIARARRRAAGLRAQILDDRRGLRFGKVTRRHRGVRNAAQDDADQLGIGRRAAEAAVTEIDVGHDVPFGAVALDAVFHVELLAVRRRPGRAHVGSGGRLRPARQTPRCRRPEQPARPRLATCQLPLFLTMRGAILRDNPSRRTPSMPATRIRRGARAVSPARHRRRARQHRQAGDHQGRAGRPDARTNHGQGLRRAGSGGSEERGHHRHRARAAKRARQGRIRHHVHAGEADGHDDGQRRAGVHRRESRRRQRCAASRRARHVRQRLAGRRRSNLDQLHDSGTGREESRRLEHYRSAACCDS